MSASLNRETVATRLSQYHDKWVAIGDDAMEIWRDATEKGVPFKSLPSLKQYVQDTHNLMVACASFSLIHHSDVDETDESEQRVLEDAKKLLADMDDGFDGLATKFVRLAEASRNELKRETANVSR